MGKNTFDIIIINGRPASGKSEVIDYLKKLSTADRTKRFHIGELDEIDDFPMLWTWFEEDAILEKILNQSRIHTDEGGYFLHDYQWHLLIERLSMDYAKRLRDNNDYHDKYTTLIEFSRGAEHGGYREAYKHLSDTILEQAVIFYVDVPWEESLRKNKKRFNPDKPDSILEHGIPDSKLERLYKDVDWPEFSAGDPEFINVKDHKIPYIVFDNNPDITTVRDERLGQVLEKLCGKLWAINNRR